MYISTDITFCCVDKFFVLTGIFRCPAEGGKGRGVWKSSVCFKKKVFSSSVARCKPWTNLFWTGVSKPYFLGRSQRTALTLQIKYLWKYDVWPQQWVLTRSVLMLIAHKKAQSSHRSIRSVGNDSDKVDKKWWRIEDWLASCIVNVFVSNKIFGTCRDIGHCSRYCWNIHFS